jgi:LPS sulfotransferase NodH
LSAGVPVTSVRQWPYAPYYAALGRWRRTRPLQLRDTVLVAGSPRSGTTWLGDIVAGLTHRPLLHEPTHAHKLPEMRDGHGWNGRPFREPGVADPDLAADLERVLTGSYLGPGVVTRSRRVDGHLWARRPLATKVIDTNLLLPWIAGELPWLKIVHIIRHPLEVVASQEARTESVWSRQSHLPRSYQALFAAHPEYEAPTEFATVAECLVTGWAIEHAWLRDRDADLSGILRVRYEDLRADLVGEAERINAHLGLPAPTKAEVVPLARPSRAVNEDAATLLGMSDTGWRSRYDRSTREALRAILARYGNPFYGPDALADRDGDTGHDAS